MLRAVWIGFLIVCAAVPLLVLAWLFSLPGTWGLYIWENDVDLLLILLAVLGILALVLLAGTGLAMVFHSPWLKVLQPFTSAAAVLGMIYGLSILGYVLFKSIPLLPSTPPLLLVSERSGQHGVPDLVLTFRTEKPTMHALRYGITELDVEIREDQPKSEHVFVFSDLLPNTRYVWQLDDGEQHTFLTPSITEPANSDQPLLRLGVGGDSQLGEDIGKDVYQKAGDVAVLNSVLAYASQPQKGYHAFFILGDLVHLGMESEHWRKALNTIAPYSLNLPIRSILGNHDAIVNGVYRFKAYFQPPLPSVNEVKAANSAQDSPLYYRVDIGKVHILVLCVPWSDSQSFGKQQEKWLREQLKSIPREEWRIVMMHSMVYASGDIYYGMPWYDPPDMVEKVAPIFEKYKVDLVLSGHNHLMEYLEKKGVTYVVVGTLGGQLEKVRFVSEASKWRNNNTYGFAEVQIYDQRIELIFRDQSGKEIKNFTIQKRRN